MREEKIPAEMMLRNPLCVRWTDADHKRVTDMAWARRLRVSELIRQLVLEGLQKMDQVDGGLNKGAEGKADMP